MPPRYLAKPLLLPRLLLLLFARLAVLQQVPGASGGHTPNLFYAFHDPRANLIEFCDAQPATTTTTTTSAHFDAQCLFLKIFNRTQLDEMDEEQNWHLASTCACHLSNMQELWDTFDDKSLRRLAQIVKEAEHYQELGLPQYPDWLWSDLDVTIHQVSIFTATRDYFYQQTHNTSLTLPPPVKRHLEAQPLWLLTREFCWRIAHDTHGLYRYTENLNRMNTVVFFSLVKNFEWIDAVYSASKACKILLLHKLFDYKLKPDDSDYIPVYQNIGTPDCGQQATDNHLELQLHRGALVFEECHRHQSTTTATPHSDKPSIHQLHQECPMVATEKVSTEWLLQHPSPLQRFQLALKCGCHLLDHAETWSLIMEDTNVRLMAKAVTNYMNRNPIPDFANSPIWTLFGWFEQTMNKFKNRQFSIEQLIMVQKRTEDPIEIVDHTRRKAALELLRQGCNFVMFNFNKNTTLVPALKLIKYLDNLREIGQDSTFVFQLTLQDVNLFKLYALSRVCKSVI